MNTVVPVLVCTIALLATAVAGPAHASDSRQNVEELLRQARTLFYRSIDDESLIPRAEASFRALQQRDKRREGRAQTYLGALTAIRAKHAFWPHDKWRLANEGLEQMDKGVALAPDDIEALFIHGTTCHYLPFFFGRADDARQKFSEIVRLLPAHLHEYDAGLIRNVLEFLSEEAELTEQERSRVAEMQRSLASEPDSDRM